MPETETDLGIVVRGCRHCGRSLMTYKSSPQWLCGECSVLLNVQEKIGIVLRVEPSTTKPGTVVLWISAEPFEFACEMSHYEYVERLGVVHATSPVGLGLVLQRGLNAYRFVTKREFTTMAEY